MTSTGLKPPKGVAKQVEAVNHPKGKAGTTSSHLPSTGLKPPKGKAKQVESFYKPKGKAGTTSSHLPTDKYHVICYMRHHLRIYGIYTTGIKLPTQKVIKGKAVSLATGSARNGRGMETSYLSTNIYHVICYMRHHLRFYGIYTTGTGLQKGMEKNGKAIYQATKARGTIT